MLCGKTKEYIFEIMQFLPYIAFIKGYITLLSSKKTTGNLKIPSYIGLQFLKTQNCLFVQTDGKNAESFYFFIYLFCWKWCCVNILLIKSEQFMFLESLYTQNSGALKSS